MKKLLYIAPYRQADGWGEASRQYLKAINYACENKGYNLKCSPIFLSDSSSDISEEYILNLESKTFSGFDCIIQKTLPQAFIFNNNFKNILLTVLETKNISHSKNIQIFNKADNILVPSQTEKETLIDAGVRRPVNNIFQPIDLEEIDSFVNQKEAAPFHELNEGRFKDYVKFYFIGEWVPRKKIIDTIVAFSLAFNDKRDNAMLIIKTSGISQEEILQQLNAELKNYKYQKKINENIKIINQHLNRQAILGLHKNADVFVCCSRGEAFCRPLAEAMRFGNIVAATDGISSSEFIDQYKIPSQIEICKPNSNNLLLDHYDENERWMESTTFSIVETFKKIYQDFKYKQDVIEGLSERNRNFTNNFDYRKIGDVICSLDIL